MIRRFIPSHLRLKIKLLLRFFTDFLSGDVFSFAKKNRKNSFNLKHKVSLSQPIKKTASFDNKVKNITTGFEEIKKVVIYPGELFSFWNIVGEPTSEKGYKKGRNIVSGELVESYGGGLCQLSGIIYHLSIMVGLEIVERYNHTVDIYTKETRFTPLGSDATVVYGYKDLRISNVFDHAIAFDFSVNENGITVFLKSTKKLKKENVSFVIQDRGTEIEVKSINRSGAQIAWSLYKKQKA